MPYRSLYPHLDIPEVDLWTLLFERKDLPFPESKELFVDGDTKRSYTYSQLKAAALEFGRGLKAQWNWQRGDVLALFTPNSVDTPVVAAGLLFAGGVGSPANPTYTAKELTFQLTDSGAKAVATQRPMLAVVREAAANAGIPESRIILLGDEHDETGRFKHFTDITGTGWQTHTKVNPTKDLAFLVYSSGTTGLPKGVCLSHHNLVANVLQLSVVEGSYFRWDGGPEGKGDVLLGILPFFHIYGLTCSIFMTLWLGWKLVVMRRFELERFCQLVEEHRVTYAHIPPPIALLLSKSPVVAKYDLTSVRGLNSGAAPLTHELAEAVWDRLKIPVKQGFGLSETSPCTHTQAPDEWAKFMGSVGKLMPNMDAKIVDEEGKEVPEGQEGELWVKGPNVFLGYLNNPEKTKEVFSPDGFFKTGDVVHRDKHGNYYVVDRIKELIKYKGFQVPPAELEGLMLGHDDIVDVCVIGVEDRANATEVPRAYVVLRPGVRADEAKARELADWVAGKAAPHKKLRGGVRFVDEVPKSQSGKILRRLLRDQAKKETRGEGAKL